MTKKVTPLTERVKEKQALKGPKNNDFMESSLDKQLFQPIILYSLISAPQFLALGSLEPVSADFFVWALRIYKDVKSQVLYVGQNFTE